MDQHLPVNEQSPSLEQGMQTLLAWLHAARDQKLSHSLEENLAQAIILFEELNSALSNTAQQIRQLNEGQEEQWQRLHTMITEFSDVLSQTGIARLRRQFEKALLSGENHLQAIEAATQQFQLNTQESLQALNQLHIDASAQLTQAAQSIELHNLVKLEEEHRDALEKLTDKAITKIKSLTYATIAQMWLLPITLGMIMTLALGYFVQDEWPWESYNRVKHEREIGQRYLHAISHLPPEQRKQFQNWLDQYSN